MNDDEIEEKTNVCWACNADIVETKFEDPCECERLIKMKANREKHLAELKAQIDKLAFK